MIETYFSQPSTLNRLRSGPLGADLDDLVRALQQQGYAPDGIRQHVRGGDQFARWLVQQGYAPSEVTPSLVKHYLSRLRRTPLDALPRTTHGIPHLLKLWREKKHVPEAIEEPPRTEADRWLLQYEQFLDQVCGVAASTRHAYRRMAKRFLGSCFGTGTWLGPPCKLSRSPTLCSKKRPPNTAVVAGFQVPRSDPFSGSWCSGETSRLAWRPPPSPPVGGIMTLSHQA